MTDAHPPDDMHLDGVHLDDDALSAAFDGEATPEQEAHIAGCPRCTARLAALGQAAAAIGTPVEIDPAAAERAVRTALDEPFVVQLGARRRWRPALPALAGAAAVLVLGLLAVPALVGDGHRQSTASPEASTSVAGPEQAQLRMVPPDAASSKAAPNTDATAGGTDTAGDGPDLGELAGADLGDRLAGVTRADADGADQATCEPAARASAGAQPPRTLVARGTWRGAPAVVLVFRTDGGERAVVLTTATCEVVADTPL